MKNKITHNTKRLLFPLLLILATLNTFAQAPQKMSYQAVVRNANNNLLVNSPVGVKVSIIQGSANGTSVYVETQSATTNGNGLMTLEIGAGTPVTGNFSSINWANSPCFVKTEIDPAGGSNYSISGTSELLSVPYALYAANVPSQRIVSGQVLVLSNSLGGNVNTPTTYTTSIIGTGFSATATISPNSYIVSFTTPFSNPPIVVAGFSSMAGQTANIYAGYEAAGNTLRPPYIEVYDVSTIGFKFKTNANPYNGTNLPISFIAIGN